MDGLDENTPKKMALMSLPPQWRERLIERAAAGGIVSDADVGWLIIGSVIDAWAAAAASGEAAETVSQTLGNLPQAVEQSISTASERAKTKLFEAGDSVGENLKREIASAVNSAVGAAVKGFEKRAEQKSEHLEAQLLKRLTSAIDRRSSSAGWGIVFKLFAVISVLFFAGLAIGVWVTVAILTGKLHLPLI